MRDRFPEPNQGYGEGYNNYGDIPTQGSFAGFGNTLYTGGLGVQQNINFAHGINYNGFGLPNNLNIEEKIQVKHHEKWGAPNIQINNGQGPNLQNNIWGSPGPVNGAWVHGRPPPLMNNNYVIPGNGWNEAQFINQNRPSPVDVQSPKNMRLQNPNFANNGWGPISSPRNQDPTKNNNGWGDFFERRKDIKEEQQKPKPQINNNNNNNGWGEIPKPIINNDNKKPQNNLGNDIPQINNMFRSSIREGIHKSIIQIKPKPKPEVSINPFQKWADDQKKKMHESRLVDPHQNVENLIDMQVTYLEPSPNEKKLQELRMKGLKFVDESFPANQSSLSGQWGYMQNWKDIKWKRISEIIPNPVIFDNKIEPNDIKQGMLGNCYFLAALAALAEKPERISNLFLFLEENGQKYYACKILHKGKWRTIDMDEYIPVLGNKPAFSKSVGNELWVILLEKAWAKLYSSYKRVEQGYIEEGIHDLTGAHMETFRFNSGDFEAEKTWVYLMKATKRVYCMVVSSQPGSDRNKAASGIVFGHAYTFMGAYELNIGGSVQRLVKLRNPWGKGESVIAWSDNDSRWKQVSSQQKQRIGYTRNENDGIFFMRYKDFVKEFRTLSVAEVFETASYVYCEQKPNPKTKGNYFTVKIEREGWYSFQLNQIPEREFENKLQNNYKYAMGTILIGKIQGKQIIYIPGIQGQARTLFKKHTLKPGKYIVFCKTFFNKYYELDYQNTLAVYGQYPCHIKPCPDDTQKGFKQKLFLNRAQQKGGKQVIPDVFFEQQICKEGYIYAACWNRSNAKARFNLNVVPNPNPTFQMKKPYRNQKKVSSEISPGGQLVIMARYSDFSYATSGLGAIEFVNVR